MDSSGNVFVSESDNGLIEKFDSNGARLAAWGTFGAGDGQFGPSGPSAIAVDGSGQVFVIDAGNFRVEKFDNNGRFLGQWGSEGAVLGQFSNPLALAVDASGNVYVADGDLLMIQKFSNDGTSATGFTLLGEFDQFITGLAVDQAGNVFVVRESDVRKFDSSGAIVTTWGVRPLARSYSGESGLGGLAVDAAGDVYLVDQPASCVQKFGNDGTFLDMWGHAGYATAQFYPRGVAVDAAGNNMFVLDIGPSYFQFGSARVQRWQCAAMAPPGILTRVAGGAGGVEPPDFYTGDGGPATDAVLGGDDEAAPGFAFDPSGNLFITQPWGIGSISGLVRRVDAATQIITTFAGGGTDFPGEGVAPTGALLDGPKSVAVNTAGDIFISAWSGVRRVNAGGTIMTWVAGADCWPYPCPGVPLAANGVIGVALDTAGNLLVSEQRHSGEVVERVDAGTGAVTRFAGKDDYSCGGDLCWGDGGPAVDALLWSIPPSGVAVDAAGNVFIANSDPVRRVDTQGIITTVAGGGNPPYPSNGDGGLATAALVAPLAIAIDSANNLFIADYNGGLVRRVDAITQIITTVAGGGQGSENGPATAAEIYPSSVAVDRTGNLFIRTFFLRDFSGDVILKVSGVAAGVPPVCGDEHVDSPEQCDDGNTRDGDGCSASCQKEPGWDCTGEPSVCTPVCGDRQAVGSEQCDDGNTRDGDGCSATTCQVEPGWTCSREQPPHCTFSPFGSYRIKWDAVGGCLNSGDNVSQCPGDRSLTTQTTDQCWAVVEPAGTDQATITLYECGYLTYSDRAPTWTMTLRGDSSVGYSYVAEGFDVTGQDYYLVVSVDVASPGFRGSVYSIVPDYVNPGCHTGCVVSQLSGARDESCHNYYRDLGEECDDGNYADDDGCVHECKAAFCGDGLVWKGNEGCDDGNAEDHDGCLSNCQNARCGDGVVWSKDCGPAPDGAPRQACEQCDDMQNHILGDGCDDYCRPSPPGVLPEFENQVACTATTHGTGKAVIGPLVGLAVTTAASAFLPPAGLPATLAQVGVGIGIGGSFMLNDLLAKQDYSAISRSSPNWAQAHWDYVPGSAGVTIKSLDLQLLRGNSSRRKSRLYLRIWDPDVPQKPVWHRELKNISSSDVIRLSAGHGLPKAGLYLQDSIKGPVSALQVSLAARFDEEGADPWCAMTTNLQIPPEGQQLAEDAYAWNLSNAAWFLDKWIHRDLRGSDDGASSNRWRNIKGKLDAGAFLGPSSDGSGRLDCDKTLDLSGCIRAFGARCHLKGGGRSSNPKGPCYVAWEDDDSESVRGFHSYANVPCRQCEWKVYPDPPSGSSLQHDPSAVSGPDCAPTAQCAMSSP